MAQYGMNMLDNQFISDLWRIDNAGSVDRATE
jgi:hypothetical protein